MKYFRWKAEALRNRSRQSADEDLKWKRFETHMALLMLTSETEDQQCVDNVDFDR